jgi:hypothetical protein
MMGLNVVVECARLQRGEAQKHISSLIPSRSLRRQPCKEYRRKTAFDNHWNPSVVRYVRTRIINPVIFIRNKHGAISSGGFSAHEKMP